MNELLLKVKLRELPEELLELGKLPVSVLDGVVPRLQLLEEQKKKEMQL